MVMGAAAGRAAGASLVRVWPEWHDAATFDRIGEYFGKPENDWGEVIIRTDPADRTGMYFLVRVNTPTALSGAKFVLQVVRPDAPDPRTYTFHISLPAKSHVAELGLTGRDWPGGRDVHPVAWRLTLYDAAGQPLAMRQSFLWAKPSP